MMNKQTKQQKIKTKQTCVYKADVSDVSEDWVATTNGGTCVIADRYNNNQAGKQTDNSEVITP